MKNPSRWILITDGVNAAVWTILVIGIVVHQVYSDSAFWFVIWVTGAVFAVLRFVRTLKKHCSNKEEQ